MSYGSHLTKLLLLSFALIFASSIQAGQARIAVSSDFTGPMQAIKDAFEKETGHTLDLVSGSSGQFYRQIINGEHFDVFLSADSFKPERLELEQKAVPGTRFTYASGQLILWSSKENFVDNNHDILKAGQFNKLAIANPRFAPYGDAAKQVLSYYGVTHLFKNKTVVDENIDQTFQAISNGDVELGFVALSQVTQDGKLISGSGWVIPANLYYPIRQQAILLRNAENNPAATEILNYLKSEKARQIILSYGYQ